MLGDLWFVLWFFLPAGIANVMPILVAKMPVLRKWDYPLDCYLIFRGKRVLGDHKTWRGLLFGVSTGLLIGVAIFFINKYGCPILVNGKYECFCIECNSVINIDSPVKLSVFSRVEFILLAFMMSAGALIGDGVKSFVKRQIGIASGKSLLIFDQVDYMIGAIFAIIWIYPLNFFQCIIAILVWGLMSLLSSYVGYLFRFKKEPI